MVAAPPPEPQGFPHPLFKLGVRVETGLFAHVSRFALRRISCNSFRACEVKRTCPFRQGNPARSHRTLTRQPARENDVVICLRADGARVTSVVGTGRQREDGEFMRISRPAPRLLSQLIWRWCWWTWLCRCLPLPSSPPYLLLDSSLNRMIAPQTLALKPSRGRT